MTNQNDGWLPAGYTVPKPPSDYMKLEDGANKFRAMSAPTMGFEYWSKENKPIRLHEMPQELPADIRYRAVKQKDGTTRQEAERIKHFWAFIVWNYEAKRLQILELTQAGIQGNIQDLAMNDDWGSPTGYDITITKKGKDLETKYTVQPSPHKATPIEATDALETTKIDLSKLFEGADPVEHDSAIEALNNAISSDETVIE